MYEFKLPDVGEGISEAELLEWRVEVGDAVAEGADIAVVETDKITVELPAPRAGRIASRRGEPGETIAVGTVLVVIDDGGEAAVETATPAPGGKAKAAPATRRLARELGVDLSALTGSGPGGRITRADVEAAAGTEPASQRRLPLSGARATAARALARSVHTLATSTTSFEVAGDGILALLDAAPREQRITATAVIAKCLAAVLVQHPRFNATIDDERNELISYDAVDLGIAVAAPSGLVVPVLRGVEARSLSELAESIADLSARARKDALTLDDVKGGSFTLSSTGGAERATFISTRPIIHQPQSAILWASRITERPRVRDCKLEAGPIMACSLSFDHRYIDGMEATAFINDLAAALESPRSSDR
ncbi:MAG: dihydrolipoamide acetyltransferase family protein [Alphaproteobacteria bacterium]|jgi:pyruvate dehydrogenase E2 component (dihydrolipoamide acetyltransferase)|nr:dihydrolipoamide acetyltransferase family protein [Alphaproteobacteria bacterium]